ncbi:MAG: hypothetical protein WKG00_11345 [Polyangiaceae bacterium]
MLLSTAWLEGCGETSCNDIGCGNHYRIDVLAESDLPAGEYTLRVHVDVVDRECTFAFPLDEHSFDAGCTIDSLVTLVDASGSNDRRFSILVDSTPFQVWVGITHDGQGTGSLVYQPKFYEVDYGNSCEICQEAAAGMLSVVFEDGEIALERF